ncbi:MAG: hypothetical protein IT583_00810 [Verrucomicrobia bacterium]|nr:hypothetical protein [Verrucomicrobiota bacterium]
MGYFSDEELQTRMDRSLPLPPASLWVNSNMRRPFTLVANAIASLRTIRHGTLAAKVRAHLGRYQFQGLKIVTSGSLPQGGFSSSSAITVAVKNGLNALFDLGVPADLLIHLAAQAEYGTGVRAGSLDQATEQKGQYAQGTLISSNPRDNYRILGTYPLPTDRISILFPYSVPRDREAWQWSRGFFGSGPGSEIPTAGEMRKLTGKTAEIVAILTDLPSDTDFFKIIEEDLLDDGKLGRANRAWVTSILRQVPLKIDKEELRQLVLYKLEDRADSSASAPQTISDALFSGWKTPHLAVGKNPENVRREAAVPLRAIMAYLFAEITRNFHMIHHPQEWIASVTHSQRGDCCFVIDPDRLPTREQMEEELPWEKDVHGPERMNRWLEQVGAVPFDFNEGLRDEDLAGDEPLDMLTLCGGNFFRGLALIDLAEAMLKRAFGCDAVAVRVNAAGQGDYFQVHVDREKADVESVKNFIRQAFYKRFDLRPDPLFVEVHPGGGAVGCRMSRADILPQVIQHLREQSSSPAPSI